MSYIYPKGYQGGAPVTEGLKFGIVMGLLWIFPFSVVLSGVMEGYSGTLLITDSVWHIVEQGIGRDCDRADLRELESEGV